MNANRDFWAKQSVIPVVVIESEALAVPLAKCLVEQGMPRIEITLRTKAALNAISKIRSEVDGALVGAGTVLNHSNFQDALAAGAQFIVSPGTTSQLRKTFIEAPVPVLPGCATVSEAMELMDLGFEVAKFFPASESGGIPMLKAVASVLQGIAFCPTGGVNASNYLDYLALPNVVCVGGSWIAPKNLIESQNWSEIGNLVSKVKERK